MKKLIYSFTFVFLMLLAFQSSAQVRFGVKAGLNLANMLDKDNDQTYSKDYTNKTGFHIGVTAEIPISDNFAVEPGILFSTKGFKLEQNGIKYVANINYLEIPVNAMYKLDLGSAKLLVFAGPYLGYAFSGKYKADQAVFGENEDQKERKIEIGTDKQKDDMKPLDLGLNFGVGAEISSITIGVQYGLGLANLSPYTDNGTVLKNKVIGISLGYKIKGK